MLPQAFVTVLSFCLRAGWERLEGELPSVSLLTVFLLVPAAG